MRRNIERWRGIDARLSREMSAWVATVRADESPHLLPVWYVWLESVFYFVVATNSEQYDNLRGNQSVSITLPSPEQVIMIEGEAHVSDRSTTHKLADYFYNKYEFDFTEDPEIDWRLVEVEPQRMVSWGDGYEHEGIDVL